MTSSRLKFLGLAIGGAMSVTLMLWIWTSRAQAAPTRASTHMEGVFQIENLAGDPFDEVANDVRVRLRSGAHTFLVPAFFDGGTTWRFRYTPPRAGEYSAESVTRNGRKLNIVVVPARWKIGGAPRARFVRLQPQKLQAQKLQSQNRRRFAYQSGAPYFPLGHNQAWKSNELPDIPQLFAKMGAAGENWSRVWMNHWDGKNLDWPPTGAQGQFNLEVARRWDAIIEAAEKNGLALQMVFQHHGQYSTRTNPNWGENPYNAKNGGFLATPNEFFTNERARVLTRRKLRYAVARWGYSPAILAWELWNEVQFTDAAHDGQWEAITRWHREMADFLRAQDGHQHLITSSASGATPKAMWEPLDFYQDHLYPADVMSALFEADSGAALAQRKPFFIGEFGPSQVNDLSGTALHNGLWAGLMSGEAGAPQYWAWDDIERANLYFHFRAAADFLRLSTLPARADVKKAPLMISTQRRADLSFSPGASWTAATQHDFDVTAGAAPAGMASLPQFLQGNAHRDMNPQPLRFRVRFAQAGRFEVSLEKVAKAGAHLKLSVGKKTVEREYSAAENDYAPAPPHDELAIDVPAGEHTIVLQNTGNDWVTMRRLTLPDYAPALAGYALTQRDFAAAWIYHRGSIAAANPQVPAVSGTIRFSGLTAGRYVATWWDTRAAKELSTAAVVAAKNGTVSLATPPVARDVALYLLPSVQSRSKG